MKKDNTKDNKKGVIYITKTVVDGLIKIGKTKTDSFNDRMYQLEHNGYRNVTGLKREFAIEVDNYADKEILIQNVFDKSRIGETELFALNINTAIQLLSSFEGKIIYPKEEKKKIFEEATEKIKSKAIPDGIYSFSKGNFNAKVEISENVWTLLKDSIINKNPNKKIGRKWLSVLNEIKLNKDGKVIKDQTLGDVTPSFAGNLVYGNSCNGWMSWKDKNGNPIDCYRQKENDEE